MLGWQDLNILQGVGIGGPAQQGTIRNGILWKQGPHLLHGAGGLGIELLAPLHVCELEPATAVHQQIHCLAAVSPEEESVALPVSLLLSEEIIHHPALPAVAEQR